MDALIATSERRRRKLLAAVCRVNKQLDAWDELDALALLPSRRP